MKPEKRGGCSKDVPPESTIEPEVVDPVLCDDLYNATMTNEWGKVVKFLKGKKIYHYHKLTKSWDTALHLLISSFHPETPSSHEKHLKEMIRVMKEGGTLARVLEAPNQRGDTPLHLAAAVGWFPIFDSVEETDPSRLLHTRNKKGETPLFVAALRGSLDDFRRLRDRFKPEERLHLDRRKDGNTILHRAILEENFELAYLIIEYYPNLVNDINEDGQSPLHVLAMKPNVFKSSSHLRLYESIIYSCTFVEKLRSDKETRDSTAGKKPSMETNLKYPENHTTCVRNLKYPENYTTCVKIFLLLYYLIVILRDSIFVIFKIRPSCGTDEENQYHQKKRLQSRGESSQAQGSAGNSSVAGPGESSQTQGSAGNSSVAGPGESSQAQGSAGNSSVAGPGESSQAQGSAGNSSVAGPGESSQTQGSAGNSSVAGPGESSQAQGSAGNSSVAGPGESSQAQGSAGNSSVAAEDENGYRSYHDLFPDNYITCVDLFKSAMKIILIILGVGFWRIHKIKEKKKRYLNAMEVLDKMLEQESSYKYDGGQRPQIDGREDSGKFEPPKELPQFDDDGTIANTATTSSTTAPQSETQSVNKQGKKAVEPEGFLTKDTPLLVAARTGILEMVKKIHRKCPIAIQELDSEEKNVLMLAAEHRHTAVFEYLLKARLPEYMFHQFDKDGNSILHLAATKLIRDDYPWRIPGSALQMQWEIKWRKHVKESLSTRSISYPNKNGETPRTIFSATHKDLKKEANDWLIKTSESCSVVAALIAAVAFATSSTVPGGLNQDKGKPVLQDEKAFDVFAVASLVALCLSVTALVFFLAIITSRCEERDFKRNLPRKLLAGLSALFASIAAILLSFCSGHTFILREELRFAVIPIYASVTIPVALFAIAQLPLYFDLLWAAYTKVPLRSYKAFCY